MPPVAGRGEPAGLLDRQERLTAAGTAAHLDAIQQANSVENDGLLFGQRVGGTSFSRARATVSFCGNPLPLNVIRSCSMPCGWSSGFFVSRSTAPHDAAPPAPDASTLPRA
jgi:hypothetical protein